MKARRFTCRDHRAGIRAALAALALSLLLPMGAARATAAPYDTRTTYVFGGLNKTKDAYLPLKTMEKFGEKDLRAPDDLAVAPDGTLFIADSGNGRVLKVAPEGSLQAEIGLGLLKDPKGVFVTPQGLLYVADVRNKAVHLFDAQGQHLRDYLRPDALLYGRDVDFKPVKVAVDPGGNVYVISEGNSGGIALFDPEGAFLGYVGANKTPLSLDEVLRRLLFTQRQRAQMKRNVPVAPVNLSMDHRGLLHTVTQGGAPDALKKFNMAGVNMFGDTRVDPLVTGLCVSALGNVYTVSSDGVICEYTQDGELLFLFGGRDDGYNRNGLFVAASAIGVDARDRLYVLDAERRSVTVFTPTEYADTVHQALALYQEGRYVESRSPWEAALAQDAMLSLAYRGIGEAYFKLEKYDLAMAAFREGRNLTGFSEAFWETRNAFLMDRLAHILLIAAGLIAAWKLLRAALRRAGWDRPLRRGIRRLRARPLPSQMLYAAALPRNPADGFYGIRHEGRLSLTGASLIYALFFGSFLLSKYGTAFLFKGVPDGHYELGRDAATVLGLVFLFVITSNLISSIQDGEARLRDVYCATASCLMPYVLIKPLMTLISHGLTLNERFILTLADFIVYFGIGVLILVMVREIQAYTYRKAFWNLLITLFTMALLIITGVIAFVLISQVADFVSSVIREVIYRAA